MSTLTDEQVRNIHRDLRLLMSRCFAVGLFAAALHYTYRTKVSPEFSYTGLTYREPDAYSYGMMIVLVIFIATVMPARLTRASDFILWTFFALGVAPSILLAQYSQTLSPQDAEITGAAVGGAFLLTLLLVKVLPSRFRVLRPRRVEKAGNFWAILLLVSAMTYSYMFLVTGFNLRFLSLIDVYDVRAEFAAATAGGALAYLVPLQANVINPLFFARGIYSGRLLMVALGVSGQVLIYLSKGQKSTLFSVALMFGVALLFKFRPRPNGQIVLNAITAASGLALLVDRWTGGITWTSLISRRMLIVPGALTAAYVSIFADLPRLKFANIVPLASNPYGERRPVNIVGEQFVGDAGTAANVNLFGDGYLQLGYAGMFIEAAFLALLLAFANSATRGMPMAVTAIVFIGPAIALVSASVFTAAVTHGFLAAVVICAFAPSRNWGRRRRPTATREARTSARIG